MNLRYSWNSEIVADELFLFVQKIYTVAYKIIEEFFTGEEDEGLEEVSVQNMSKQIDTTFDF